MTITENKNIVRVHIRWMIRRDMKEVCKIEQESFEFPWFEEEFVECLRKRNCIGMVAESGERVVGFMIYELRKKGLELLNLAVDPDMHLHGIGTQMIDKLIGKLSPDRRTEISVVIRERNLAAQLFFKKQGFIWTKTLKDTFEDSPKEDAYQMQYFGASN